MSLPKNWKRSARRVQRVAKSAIDKSKVLAGLELVEFGLAAQVLHAISDAEPTQELIDIIALHSEVTARRDPVVTIPLTVDCAPLSPWPGDWAWARPKI